MIKNLHAMSVIWRFFLTATLSIYCSVASADAPLPPPSIATICNATKSHCATTDPSTNKTTLFKQPSGATEWSINRYIRFFQISNDGRAILAQSDFANLAPTYATNEHVLFDIYRDGKLIQTVKLSTLFESPSKLRRTVSHLSWGYIESIDANDNAVLSLIDGRKVSYSLITGIRVAQ
jgi:hypothetical protein